MIYGIEQNHAPDRLCTNCSKWDDLKGRFGEGNLISMWIADMDFQAPPSVLEALRARIEHGIFGYHIAPDAYYEAFINWEKKHHGYEVKKEWIRFSPDIVSALYWLVNLMTQPGDACIVMTPVYYPFHDAVKNNGRKLICSDLINTDGIYTIDYEKFEKDITDNDVKMFILCSPHNPVGRVWTREELIKTLDICKKHNVFVASDEIHQDLIIGDKKQIPSATVGDYDDILVTLTAASKTFNLAGCKNSFVIIPNEDVRAKFDRYVGSLHVINGNLFGYIAVEAAYRGGEDWLAEVIEIIRGNYNYIKEVFAKELPDVVVTPLEGTYLAWFDFSKYMPDYELKDFMQGKCRIAVDYGEWFGFAGAGHIRMNLATPRKWIIKAVENIVTEMKKR